MTREELIARALALAGTTEKYPFGEDLLTVKVGGKVFAWIPLGDAGWLGQGPRMAVKLRPTSSPNYTTPTPARQAPPGRWTQRYWVTIPLAADIPDSEICELLTLSYPLTIRAALAAWTRVARGVN